MTDEELAELKASWQRAEVRRWFTRHRLFAEYQAALKQREREGAA